MRIRIYTADASALNAEEVFREAYEKASPERKAKTDALRFRKDKNASLCAELLLMQACRDAGISWPPEITVGPRGKPDFREGGLRFSLSHSGERAMCAVAEMPLGCDTEKIGKVNESVARRCFSPEEQAYLNSAGGGREQRFYEIWTCKESYLKYTGEGLSLPMESFSVMGKENCVFWHRSPGDGYCYAICIGAKGRMTREEAEEVIQGAIPIRKRTLICEE